MQEDFYQYYGPAPVTAWVFSADLEEGLKVLTTDGHKIFKYEGSEDEAKAEACINALNWAKAEH